MQIDALTKKGILYNIKVNFEASKSFDTTLKSENIENL